MKGKILKIINEMILSETNKIDTNLYPTMHDHKREILMELKSKVSRVELPVGMPSETLSCEQVRLDAIEECAKLLESYAEKNNDVLIEERHLLQEDTVENFRNDIEFLRGLANNLRKLASKP